MVKQAPDGSSPGPVGISDSRSMQGGWDGGRVGGGFGGGGIGGGDGGGGEGGLLAPQKPANGDGSAKYRDSHAWVYTRVFRAR